MNKIFIKTNHNKIIKLRMTHESSFKTRQSIERYAQSAYNDLVDSIDFLNKERNKEELLEIIKTIYGTKRSAYDVKYDLIKLLTKLKDRFEETFAFASIPTYYQDIQSNIQYKEVYALIYKDFNSVIYLFKPFFEEETDELDNRGTVILHELAHVIGLNSEKELNDIKSAESLRNFILLVTKKVSKEALLESIKNAPPKLKLSTSVLAYSPDQPRDPKGTPTGGQWSSDDNNSSNQNGKSEDDSKASKSDKETQSEESKEEKSEEIEENTESETQENSEDSESKELDENKQKVLDSIIEANAEQLDKLSQSEQEAFKEAIANELKDGDAHTTNSLRDKLNTLIKDTLKNGVKLASTDLDGLKGSEKVDKDNTVSKEKSGDDADWTKCALEHDKENSTISYKNHDPVIDGQAISIKFAPADNTGKRDVNNYDEPLEKALNIGRDEINSRLAVWMSTTVKLEGYPPNSDQTVVFDAIYTYNDPVGGLEVDKVKVVYDVKADKNGTIVIERLGILNVIPSLDGVETGINDNGSFMDISIEISSIAGRTIENFNEPKPRYWNRSDLDNNPNSQSVTDYLSAHASRPNYDINKNIQKSDYKGGIVGNKISSNKETKIFSFKINTAMD